MKVAMGCDHGGFELKEIIKGFLQEKGYEITDCGCYSTESCDYPQYGKAVAKEVLDGKAEKGIVICTTGIGMSIVANKIKGIRCALCHNEHTATMTRLHNDSNVLAMGAKEISVDMAKTITEIFLTTDFSKEEKHSRRISQMED
ncbi:MAG TPA: ribose 5-phosphate isomerase B [Lachnospiraceae bacterium]|nr:ribose 5-phosphate isomerase B [Lachnospiraceae bacterium]HPF30624.1 ribose 5-phosphate isomerase B [Lachnospiraceae bacterium]